MILENIAVHRQSTQVPVCSNLTQVLLRIGSSSGFLVKRLFYGVLCRLPLSLAIQFLKWMLDSGSLLIQRLSPAAVQRSCH